MSTDSVDLSTKTDDSKMLTETVFIEPKNQESTDQSRSEEKKDDSHDSQPAKNISQQAEDKTTPAQNKGSEFSQLL